MMDELTPENLTVSVSNPAPIMYSARQVSTAAYLGGAIAGGWLMSRNFGAVGDQGQQKVAIFGSLLLTAAMAVGAMWLPTDFPSSLIPLVAVGIFSAWYYFKLQAVFAAHRDNGGAQATWWKTIGISVVAFVITFMVFIVPLLSLPILPINHIKDGPNVVFYEGEATRQNAESLGTFLRETGVFNDNTSGELTLLFPKNDSRRAVIKLPYAADIEGTPAHNEIRELAVLLEEEKYTVKSVEIQIQNAFGLTTLVVRNE